MSSTIARNVIPIGTSTSPTLTTRPVSANTFVPRLFSVPSAASWSGPSRMITGTFAKVSTLLISVGQPSRPAVAG